MCSSYLSYLIDSHYFFIVNKKCYHPNIMGRNYFLKLHSTGIFYEDVLTISFVSCGGSAVRIKQNTYEVLSLDSLPLR